MASEARIGIRTETKHAEQGITSVRGMFQKLGQDAKSSILAGVGLGAGVTAFNALSGAVSQVGDFLMDSVRAAAEEEAGIRRLTTAIQENDASWDGNIAAIEQVIDQREKLGFADNEQRDSLAVLTSVTKDHNKALELQRTAMDLARLRGMSLATASELLGKVYAGNMGILSRYGIVLEEGTSATEALAEIQRRAAGQAEAYADTAAGAAESLRVEFENLQEDIGAELLPVMTELAKVARDEIVPALRDTVAFIKENAEGIGEWVEGVRSLVDPLGQMRDSLLEQAQAAEEAAEANARAGDETTKPWIDNLPAYQAATQTYASTLPSSLDRARTEAKRIVKVTLDELVDSLVSGQTDWQEAWEDYGEIMENDLTEAEEIAQLEGMLVGQELADGLNSTDPERRAAAEAMKATIEERLFALRNGVPAIAAATGQGYATALAGETWRIRSAAGTYANTVRENLNIPASTVYGWGKSIGITWANGLLSATSYVKYAGETLASQASGSLAPWHSPPRFGPLKDLDTDAQELGKLWAENLAKGADGWALPGSIGTGGTGGMIGAAGAYGDPVRITLEVDGRTLAEVVDRQLYYMRPTSGLVPRG